MVRRKPRAFAPFAEAYEILGKRKSGRSTIGNYSKRSTAFVHVDTVFHLHNAQPPLAEMVSTHRYNEIRSHDRRRTPRIDGSAENNLPDRRLFRSLWPSRSSNPSFLHSAIIGKIILVSLLWPAYSPCRTNSGCS